MLQVPQLSVFYQRTPGYRPWYVTYTFDRDFRLTFLQNIFGEKLGRFGFNPYEMLVVDLMHEFELGVWKAVFTHLVRILYAAAPAGRIVGELDKRYDLSFFTDVDY